MDFSSVLGSEIPGVSPEYPGGAPHAVPVAAGWAQEVLRCGDHVSSEQKCASSITLV